MEPEAISDINKGKDSQGNAPSSEGSFFTTTLNTFKNALLPTGGFVMVVLITFQ